MSRSVSESSTGVPCPVCGSPLLGLDPAGICMGSMCLVCGYRGPVATNSAYRTISQDDALYSKRINCDEDDRKRLITSVAVILGIGVIAARRIVDGKGPVASERRAEDIVRLVRAFRAAGFDAQIDPQFPWSL